MKITDLLDPRSISLDAAPTSKSETLDKAVELMAASGKLSDVEAFRKQVYAREEESTTGIGEGLQFLMENVMRSKSRGWRRWSSKMAWISTPWTANRSLCCS